jgi:hypothetical protein
MLKQTGSICCGHLLRFQSLSRRTRLTRRAPNSRLSRRFFVFFAHPGVVNVPALFAEKLAYVPPYRSPPPSRNAGDARQLGGVIREPRAVLPHGDEQQEIGPVLLRGEVHGIPKIVGRIEGEVRKAHPTYPLISAHMAAAVGRVSGCAIIRSTHS